MTVPRKSPHKAATRAATPKTKAPAIKSKANKPPPKKTARKYTARQLERAAAHRQPIIASGIWVTELEYAKMFRISRQTLANWRVMQNHGKINPT